MLFEDDHITLSSCKLSKTTSEIALAHRQVLDLLGEIKTVMVCDKGASIHAAIYEKSRKIFCDRVDVAGDCYRESGVPYKIAVANVQNELLLKMKAIMQQVALSREVVPEEQESFIKMVENACKAFPNLSRQQGMLLALDALRAKRKRQPVSMDDEAELAAN